MPGSRHQRRAGRSNRACGSSSKTGRAATREYCWDGLEELRPVIRDFLVRRCRDTHEAEDCAQESLLRAARYRASLETTSRLRAWLLRIAANVFRDHVRRAGMLPQVGQSFEGFDGLEGRERAPGEPAQDDWFEVDGQVLERELLVRELEEALLELRARDRQVLRSYYLDGKDTSETASDCGVSRALVKVRLFRARKRLGGAVRERLETARPATPSRLGATGVAAC